MGTAVGDPTSWYVARTKPRLEGQTQAVLMGRGIETYLPKIARRGASGRRAKEEPLFPGYLFCRIDAGSADWITVRSAPGIAYFLTNSSGPAPVADAVVLAIRERTGRENSARPACPFRPGDKVLVVGGPLGELEAVFDRRLSSGDRARILVNFLSRTCAVQVDLGKIKKAV